jgi:hypothetical protein
MVADVVPSSPDTTNQDFYPGKGEIVGISVRKVYALDRGRGQRQ